MPEDVILSETTECRLSFSGGARICHYVAVSDGEILHFVQDDRP